MQTTARLPAPLQARSSVLAVYVPFGSDETLSNFPDGNTRALEDHPLIDAWRQVAKAGTPVMALVDRVGADSYLVNIPAEQPEAMTLRSLWKLDMRDGRTLSNFLMQVHEAHPKANLVLGLEGHGAGYLPELDSRRLTWQAVCQGAAQEWKIGEQLAQPLQNASNGAGGAPVLWEASPLIPGGNPLTPINHQPMPTHTLGQALKSAQQQGCPKLAAIYFDNCFNMSAELLHTVAPYAEAAGGFCNYNFFTAGQAYALAFQKLADVGRATPLELAQWLTDANHAVLAAKGGHPTVGGALALSRMADIKEGVHVLAGKLLDAMASSPDRAGTVAAIQKAIFEAQQYDTLFPMELEAPDQLTDLYSLAAQMAGPLMAGYPSVQDAAAMLASLLKDIKQYGDKGMPWMADEPHEGQYVWDFTELTLAMNIFLPDPLREGQWDWRSNYYIDTDPQPFPLLNAQGEPQKDANGQVIMLPPAQTGVIDFLKGNNWIEFLKEYHRDTKFKSFFVGKIPQLPVQKADYQAPVVKGEEPPTCRMPRRPWPLTHVAKEMLATVREQATKLMK